MLFESMNAGNGAFLFKYDVLASGFTHLYFPGFVFNAHFVDFGIPCVLEKARHEPSVKS